MAFNPFEKQVGETLSTTDLQVLLDRQIPEGYYIEYKSDFQKPEKIAKSIAAFANTYGGWYFVGVVSDKTTSIASNLAGINLANYPDPISTVRNAARDHIDPMPLLFPQLVEVAPAQRVLAAYVPESDDTPHVCSDGRIYRRAADSSDPVFEKDRYTLDRLVERGKESLRCFDEFCVDERTFCKAEGENPWFEAYFAPYPTGSAQSSLALLGSALEPLLDLTKRSLTTSFFDDATTTAEPPLEISCQVQTGYNSVLIRWQEPARLAFNTLEMELYADGRCRMLAPLSQLNLSQLQKTASPAVQEWLKSIADDAEADNYLLKFVDLRSTWGLISWMVALYTNWLGTLNWKGETWARLRLTNIWRCVPFSDTRGWLEHVHKFGLPVSHKGTVDMPSEGRRPLQMSFFDKAAGLAALLSLVGLALGVPIGSLWEWVDERTRPNNARS